MRPGGKRHIRRAAAVDVHARVVDGRGDAHVLRRRERQRAGRIGRDVAVDVQHDVVRAAAHAVEQVHEPGWKRVARPVRAIENRGTAWRWQPRIRPDVPAAQRADRLVDPNRHHVAAERRRGREARAQAVLRQQQRGRVALVDLVRALGYDDVARCIRREIDSGNGRGAGWH